MITRLVMAIKRWVQRDRKEPLQSLVDWLKVTYPEDGPPVRGTVARWPESSSVEPVLLPTPSKQSKLYCFQCGSRNVHVRQIEYAVFCCDCHHVTTAAEYLSVPYQVSSGSRSSR